MSLVHSMFVLQVGWYSLKVIAQESEQIRYQLGKPRQPHQCVALPVTFMPCTHDYRQAQGDSEMLHKSSGRLCSEQGETCIQGQHSLIHQVAPGAALPDEGLNVLAGFGAVGLHAPTLLVGDSQCMGAPPVTGIMRIQVVLVSQAVVCCHAMTACNAPQRREHLFVGSGHCLAGHSLGLAITPQPCVALLLRHDQ